jgi:hypothetical protein
MPPIPLQAREILAPGIVEGRCRHLPHARRRRIDRLSRLVQPFGFELPELMGGAPTH